MWDSIRILRDTVMKLIVAYVIPIPIVFSRNSNHQCHLSNSWWWECHCKVEMNPTWYNTCTSLHIYISVHLYVHMNYDIFSDEILAIHVRCTHIHIPCTCKHATEHLLVSSFLSSLEVLNMRPPALMVWRCVVLLNALTVRSARECLRYRIPETSGCYLVDFWC